MFWPRIIFVAQQLIGASSQYLVSTVVGQFYTNSYTLRSTAISITIKLSIITTTVYNNILLILCLMSVVGALLKKHKKQ